MDITEVTAAQLAALEANAFFDAVLSATPDFTFVTDLATGLVIYASHDSDVLGMTSQRLAALDGDGRLALVHPDERRIGWPADAEAGAIDDGRCCSSLPGHARWRSGGDWGVADPVPARTAGAALEVLAVLRDITEVVESEDRLAHKALHDELTGLPNRAWLVDRLDNALDRDGSGAQQVAVLFCDLDGFKRVNDTRVTRPATPCCSRWRSG